MKTQLATIAGLLFMNVVAAQTVSCQLLCNGNFENTNVSSVALVTVVPCWSTTATDGLMEVWASGFNGVPSASSGHHMELNATQAATMYQDFPATSGQVLTISFAHRGRAGIDSMAVSIGPVNGPFVPLGRYGDGTSAWGFYSVTYTVPVTGTLRLRFTPIYWSGNNAAIGNFLDAVSVTTAGSVSVSASSPTICAGKSVTLTVTGTTSFTWSNASTVTPLVVTPPVTTAYSLAAVNGTCLIPASITITVMPQPTLSIAGNPGVCSGAVVTLTASGAQSYTWNPGAISGSVLSQQLSTGTYTVAGTGTSGCTGTTAISVSVSPVPTISTAPSLTVCAGTPTLLSASGASSYTWMPGSVVSPVLQVSPVSPLVYTVTGAISGCTASATSSVYIKPVPVASAGSDAPKCVNGTLQLFAGGGAAFSWSGPAGFQSSAQNPVITNLTAGHAGIYQVTVTGLNGCSASASTTVSLLPSPALTAAGSSVCVGQPLTLTAGSGTGTSFFWTGPANFSSTQQNPVILNAAVSASGVYTVKATSVNGCTIAATVMAAVAVPPVIASALSSQTFCAQGTGGSPASIMITPSGASAYTLSMPPGFAVSGNGPFTVSKLPPYPSMPAVVIATLAGGNGVCSATVPVMFTVIPNPVVTVPNPAVALCTGQSHTFIAQGASQFVWVVNGVQHYGPAWSVTPAASGVFAVTGSSAGCSSAPVNVSITVNPLPIISVSPASAVICRGSSATLVASGTASGYTWSPAGSLNTVNSPTVVASPSVFTQYIVTGAAKNCTGSAVASVSVSALPVAVASISTPTVCVNGSFTLSGKGGVTYHWLAPDGTGLPGQQVALVASGQSGGGTYTLQVTDANGCSSTATTALVVQPLPLAALTGPREGCAPFCTTLDVAALPGSSVNVTFDIGGKKYVPPFAHCFKTAGIHIVTGRVTDPATGCTNSQTYSVTAHAGPEADFYWSPAIPVESREPVMFYNNSKGEAQERWSWHFISDRGFRSTEENTSCSFPDAGRFPVALVVTDARGCVDTVVKYIDIAHDFVFYLPNTFTPNDDGRNEVFAPVARGVATYELSVFDRWGERVFHTEELSFGWDGNYRGKPSKEDVYAVLAEVHTVSGERKIYKGHVTLYR